MLRTYVLARDHLEQAAAILKGGDEHTLQIRAIVERTITLMEEFEDRRRSDDKVVRFDSYWSPRR